LRHGDRFEPDVKAGLLQTSINYWGKFGAHWILDKRVFIKLKIIARLIIRFSSIVGELPRFAKIKTAVCDLARET